MSAVRPKLLMGVFNVLDFDGRVQRSAESLSRSFDVEVLAIDGRGEFQPSGYRLSTLPVAMREFGRSRLLHLKFMRAFVSRALVLRPAVIYAHDFFLAMSGWMAARACGARFVYDAHELILPGALGRTRGQAGERVWYGLERFVVGRADLVVAANEHRARAMFEHYRLTRLPTVVANIAVPPTQDAQLPAAVVRARYPFARRSIDGERLCVYQGDVDFDRGLSALVDAFRLLGPTYRLLIIGGGPDVEKLRVQAQEMNGVARIEVVGKVPRDALCQILRVCDIGVVMYSFRGLNNVYCAPNKVFEYAQAGLPVVATAQPPLRRMVEDSGIGCLAGEDAAPSPKQVADAIRETAAAIETHRAAIPRFLSTYRWQDEMARLHDAVYGLSRWAPDA